MASACPATPGQAAAPNVLFIIFDDLNDATGKLGGHPQALTPNLDRFMREGITFTNASCNAPLCAPSRPSMLTGLYPHTARYFGSKVDQPNREGWRDNAVYRDAKTWMEHFGDHGYEVWGTGKLFHNYAEDWSVWRRDGQNRFGVKPGWGPFPSTAQAR